MTARTAGTTRRPTARQLDVLRLVARGLTNARVGARLGVSEDAVRTQLRSLFAKLGARDRSHAVAIGYETGLLTRGTVRAAQSHLPPHLTTTDGGDAS